MNDIGIASQKEKCKKHERLEHSLLSLCPNGGVERSPRNAEPLKAGQSEVDIRSNDLLDGTCKQYGAFLTLWRMPGNRVLILCHQCFVRVF